MNPYRGIVHEYRQSDGLSTTLNGPNTLTCQSVATNNAPRDLLHNPITGVTNWSCLLNCFIECPGVFVSDAEMNGDK